MKFTSISFFVIFIGLFLLFFDILPFAGWILITLALILSVIDILLRQSSPKIKVSMLIFTIIILIVLVFLLIKSSEQILLDGKYTVDEIGHIVGNVVKVFN